MTSHGGFQGKPVRGQPVLAQNEQRWGSVTSWAASETRDTTCGHTLVPGPALGHARQSGTPVSGQQGPSARPWVTDARGSGHTPPQSTGLHPGLAALPPHLKKGLNWSSWW